MKKVTDGYSAFRKVVGANLKQARKEKHLTGTAVGNIAGYENESVAKNWTSKIEKGTYDMLLVQAVSICRELGISLDRLIDGYDHVEAESGIVPLCPTTEEREYVETFRKLDSTGKDRFLQYLTELQQLYPKNSK